MACRFKEGKPPNAVAAALKKPLRSGGGQPARGEAIWRKFLQ